MIIKKVNLSLKDLFSLKEKFNFLFKFFKKDACQFHPGNPVFHDALKGWSCCNKKSTDFTQFLNIPGCARAAHSNTKPPEPEKPKETIETKSEEVYVYEAKKPPEPAPRPTENEPLIELKRTIAPSLKVVLEKLNETNKETSVGQDGAVPVGTPCKNATCQAVRIFKFKF